jgi:hypothetical protein
MLKWPELKLLVEKRALARGLTLGREARNSPDEYSKRLHTEMYEIEKQGANNVMAGKFNAGYDPETDTFNPEMVYHTNKSGLVFPWLLGMTDVDPIGINQELKILDESGYLEDAIVIKLGNGDEVVVSPHTEVLTAKGFKQARFLTEDDIIGS